MATLKNTKNIVNLLHKALSYKIQGIAFEVRRNFGLGHKEQIYQRAFEEELKGANVPYEREKSIKIYSTRSGKIVGSYRPDLIANQKIPIEVKSSRFTTKQDEKQLYYYLRNSQYELGYLINFSTPRLFIKRIIYTNDKKPFLKTK